MQLYSCKLYVHFVGIMSIIHDLLLLNATDEFDVCLTVHHVDKLCR